MRLRDELYCRNGVLMFCFNHFKTKSLKSSHCKTLPLQQVMVLQWSYFHIRWGWLVTQNGSLLVKVGLDLGHKSRLFLWFFSATLMWGFLHSQVLLTFVLTDSSILVYTIGKVWFFTYQAYSIHQNLYNSHEIWFWTKLVLFCLILNMLVLVAVCLCVFVLALQVMYYVL